MIFQRLELAIVQWINTVYPQDGQLENIYDLLSAKHLPKIAKELYTKKLFET